MGERGAIAALPARSIRRSILLISILTSARVVEVCDRCERHSNLRPRTEPIAGAVAALFSSAMPVTRCDPIWRQVAPWSWRMQPFSVAAWRRFGARRPGRSFSNAMKRREYLVWARCRASRWRTMGCVGPVRRTDWFLLLRCLRGSPSPTRLISCSNWRDT
jgi:hypothetical protein